MTISSLIGSRLLSGIAAFALTGSLVGATAVAAQPENSSPVRELRHEVRDQSKAQREEIKQLRSELAAEYVKDQPDTAKLERLHAQIEAKRSAISKLRFDALIEMHDQLDAEQRQKIAERMAHEGKRHDKRGDGAKGKKGEKGEKGKKNRPETAAKDGKKDHPGKNKGKGKGKGKQDRNTKAETERAPV